MTDTLHILDVYRLPLVAKEHAMDVMAVVAREGRATEHDVASVIGADLPAIRHTLTALFRARLLTQDDASYELTALGSGFASRLGISTAAVRSYLSGPQLAPKQREFLLWCYEMQSAQQVDTAGAVLSHVRAWNTLAHHRVISQHDWYALGSRVSFAIIVGADADLHRHGPDRFFDALTERSERDADVDLIHFDIGRSTKDWVTQKTNLVERCEIARLDTIYSDRCLSFGESVAPGPHRDSALALTCVRLFSALAGQAASAPQSLGRFGVKSPTLVWQELDRWRPGIAESTYSALCSLKHLDAASTHIDAISALTEALARPKSFAPHHDVGLTFDASHGVGGEWRRRGLPSGEPASHSWFTRVVRWVRSILSRARTA